MGGTYGEWEFLSGWSHAIHPSCHHTDYEGKYSKDVHWRAAPNIPDCKYILCIIAQKWEQDSSSPYHILLYPLPLSTLFVFSCSQVVVLYYFHLIGTFERSTAGTGLYCTLDMSVHVIPFGLAHIYYYYYDYYRIITWHLLLQIGPPTHP